MKIYDSITQLIGHTPLLELKGFTKDKNLNAAIIAKLEFFNPAGSVKDRVGLAMIDDAEQKGLIKPGAVIIEPTSGNTGIGLALVGAVRGYKVKIIMPDSVSEERRKLVKQYGADVILVHDRGNIGDCIKECLDIALNLQKGNHNVFVPPAI